MLVRGPNYIGRAVQTDPTSCSTLWRLLNKRNVASCWPISDRFQALRNNSQQHATTCNRVCKRTQQVTSNNVASVCTIGFIPTAKLKNGRDSPRKAREANLRILEPLAINNRDD